MSWHAPITWVFDQFVDEDDFNEQIRDNMLVLGGAGSRGSSFPGSPVDGQIHYFEADAGNAVIWMMKYRTSSGYWEYIGGSPLAADASDLQSFTDQYTSHYLTPNITLPKTGVYVMTWGLDVYGGGVSADIRGQGAVAGAGVSVPQRALAGGGVGSASGTCRFAANAGQATSVMIRNEGGSYNYSSQYRYAAVTPVRLSP